MIEPSFPDTDELTKLALKVNYAELDKFRARDRAPQGERRGMARQQVVFSIIQLLLHTNIKYISLVIETDLYISISLY